MVSKEEYKKYIKELVGKDSSNSNLKYLEKDYIKSSNRLSGIGVFMFFLCFACVVLQQIELVAVFIGISILFFFIGINKKLNIQKARRYYEREYKDQAIGYLLKDYKYNYERNGQINSNIFDNSQFERFYDRYSGLDKLSINIPNNDNSVSDNYLTLCNLDVERREEDDEGEVRYVSVYRGVFGYAEFDKDFNCILCLDSSYFRRGVSLKKVVLEDITFNKKFMVSSSDQIEARYILTPEMMEYMLKLDRFFPGFKMTFVDNKMYFGFEGADILELKPKDGTIESMFDNFYEEINVLLSLVETIKNNDKVFKM